MIPLTRMQIELPNNPKCTSVYKILYMIIICDLYDILYHHHMILTHAPPTPYPIPNQNTPEESLQILLIEVLTSSIQGLLKRQGAAIGTAQLTEALVQYLTRS